MSVNENQNPPETGGSDQTSETEKDIMAALDFPGEIDWSETVLIRCDQEGGPYSIRDVIKGLHSVVRRNQVFNIGATSLNHVFTLCFKYPGGAENFLRYLNASKVPKKVNVKDRPCDILPVPITNVNIVVKWIPLEIDTAHIIEELRAYGTVVKSEWAKSDVKGWQHVYTNERKFTMHLKYGCTPNDIPYGIKVKGLLGSLFVEQRNPKCLECYYTGHKGNECSFKECMFNQS